MLGFNIRFKSVTGLRCRCSKEEKSEARNTTFNSFEAHWHVFVLPHALAFETRPFAHTLHEHIHVPYDSYNKEWMSYGASFPDRSL